MTYSNMKSGTASVLWEDEGQPIFVVDVFVIILILQFNARARRRQVGQSEYVPEYG
jgi:hypothetical protein